MILGIDPGFTGAIAYLDDHGLEIDDLPIKRVLGKKFIDSHAFGQMIRLCHGRNRITYAVLEDVVDIAAMPGNSSITMTRFVYNAGILEGVLAAFDIKILKVRPSVWKPALGLDKDKKKSLALAKKYWPQYESYFKLAKHDGRAEAALLAYFARKSL